MIVSRHCGILWTKVEVVGLAWSSFASLTNSPTVITPGISMPHRRCIFTFFQCVNSSLLSDAGDIISQHLLRRDKNCNLEKNPVRNFTTSWRDGGRSSTEARRALLRPLLLLVRLEPAHHCKHTPGYYYSSARATRAFNSHLPDQRLFLKTKI